MLLTKLLAAFVLAGAVVTAASSAQAVPITTNPGPLVGAGVNSTAIFAFVDAGDTSELVLTGFGGNPIFNNQTDAVGETVDLGALSGPQIFGLNDLSTATSFLATVADADGNFHALYTTNFADFGVGALNGAVAAIIAALPTGTSVTFVGWEDRTNAQGSDFDYNDLIFAFTNLTPVQVPEPMSLGLIGVGLVGIAFVRRRRKAA